MLIKIERNILLKSLSHIQGVVERRNTIPILSNVKIDAEDNIITLTATDMDIAISETLSAEITKNNISSITVPAHTLHDIVRKLPEQEEISLEYNSDSNKLFINASNCNFSLPVIAANDFPTIETGDITHNFNISKKDMSKLLNKSKFAISNEETRYYLNGVFLHDTVSNGKNVLRAVATDGHRLARIEVPLPDGAKDIPAVIIPKKAVYEIKKILDEEADNKDVRVELSQTKIKITFNNSIFISKLIDGTFPDYERVIPTNNNLVMSTDRKVLTDAIDRVSIISSDKTNGVKITINEGKMKLAADSVDSGSAQEEITVDYKSNIIETGFNAKYLLELTSILGGEYLKFHFADGTAPAIVYDDSDESSLYVIMPMHI